MEYAIKNPLIVITYAAICYAVVVFITIGVRGLLLTIKGQSLALLAPKKIGSGAGASDGNDKKLFASESRRSKAASSSKPDYAGDAALELEAVAKEDRLSQTEESGGLISRLAADFEAKNVFTAETQTSQFAGVPSEYARDVSQ